MKLFVALALVACISAHAADLSKPLKVFILAGQSNMEGPGIADGTGPDYNGGRGTLAALLQDPAKGAMFAHLRNAGGKWTTREDVWVRYKREDRPLLAGPLSVGLHIMAPAISALSCNSDMWLAMRSTARCCSSRRRGAGRACSRTFVRHPRAEPPGLSTQR